MTAPQPVLDFLAAARSSQRASIPKRNSPRLRDLGIDKAQGHYLARPMPLMAVSQFLIGEWPAPAAVSADS